LKCKKNPPTVTQDIHHFDRFCLYLGD